jgi:hypothetical protein
MRCRSVLPVLLATLAVPSLALARDTRQRTRAYLDGLPVRGKLRGRLETCISESSPRYYSLSAAGGQVA